MTQLHQVLDVRHGVGFKWSRAILRNRFGLFRRFFRYFWDHVLACSFYLREPSRYRRLRNSASPTLLNVEVMPEPSAASVASPACTDLDASLVALKVILLGDRRTGKTSFMMKSVGDVEGQGGLQMNGLNLMDKSFSIGGDGEGGGARIVFSIWDVGGDGKFLDHIPIACKDAMAILIMFDLTSRQTLINSIDWYREGRKHNKAAITILIGTKFDDFVQLPLGIQWMIVNQARAYARGMNASLFFSSATHEININKIFKFITAKLFNLPWTLERNLTLGEPIIDFS